MLELIAAAILTGGAWASAKQLKESLKPRKGNAKKPSDFKRRKAAARKKVSRR
jgi:hypothetical protein